MSPRVRCSWCGDRNPPHRMTGLGGRLCVCPSCALVRAKIENGPTFARLPDPPAEDDESLVPA